MKFTHASCVSIDLINPDKPPAALAFMAGACEQAKLEYECYSVNAELFTNLTIPQYNKVYNSAKTRSLPLQYSVITPLLNNIIDKISSNNSDLVLVSLFSYLQFPLSVMFLTKLRERLPNVQIIAGGPGLVHLSAGESNGKKLLSQGLINYYVLGEGDIALKEFLANGSSLYVNSTRSLSEIWAPQINNLDDHYIIPSYAKISFAGYKNLENKPIVVSLSTSRGCVRACSFCDVAKQWPMFRHRSVDNVMQEIMYNWETRKVVNYTIVDSLINGNAKSFKEFNKRIVAAKEKIPGFANFSYNGMFIVRSKSVHTEEMFADMAAAGCENLQIGVETGSDRLRFNLNKKFTNEDLEWHLEMCRKYKIQNTFLMFAGHPLETAQDFEDTLQMLTKYQHYLIDKTILGINFSGLYSLLPDTPDAERLPQLGVHIISNSDNPVLNWEADSLPLKERVLRDINFRLHAITLRYPMPYATRYVEYLKDIDPKLATLGD